MPAEAAKAKRQRLDVALVERGLEGSRERGRALIVAGEVTVNGRVVTAPSTLIAADAEIVLGKQLPYVSRGGLKLAHALDRFGIDPAGRVCLDAGASTGGFTDVLLQRSAARVYAVDVGRGQLAWRLRTDARVVVMEGVNARYLRPNDLPERVGLVVVDVAFISLRLVLPALVGVMEADGELVALVKPQFEAGVEDVGRGGVVRKAAVHRRVLEETVAAVEGVGLTAAGLTASPIRGQAGNVEFLLWATRTRTKTAKEGGRVFVAEAAIEAALAEAPVGGA